MLDDETLSAISRLAIESKVEPAALCAVVDVESGGRIFARVDGRQEPVIRFEGHYFYRLLGKAKRNIAVTRGLADRRAGNVRNPRSQKDRWSLVRRAISIDRDAALQSVSWGVGQVMGIHWRWLNYASLDAMVSSARSGLAGQVSLMIAYIRKAGLMEAMAAHDWAAFARGYNGPAYKTHGYDKKLAAAWERYAGAEAEKRSDRLADRHRPLLLRFGDQGDAVAELQRQLTRQGVAVVADGDFGRLTRDALLRFQHREGLVADGIAGPRTFTVLAR